MRWLAALLLSLVSLTPAVAGVQFCSDFKVPVRFAVAYQTEKGWVTEGWVSVDPKKCIVDPRFDGLTGLRWTAESAPYTQDGEQITTSWGKGQAFSVKNEPFKLEGADKKLGGARFIPFSGGSISFSSGTVATVKIEADASSSMSTAAAPKSPLKVDADYVTCQNKSGDEAIAGCDRAIASGKFDDELLSDLYNGRGVERQNKGELDAAQADFAEAMRLNPKNAFAYGNRGRLNLVKKDYDAAITDYNKAIEISPTYLSAYTGRGDAYLKKHDPGRAIEEYKKALALKPKAELKQRIERALSEAYSNHGLAQKDDAAAISDYDEALKLNPDNYAALNNRGAAFVRTGDYDRAIQDLDSALKLKTDSSVLFRNRGDAYRGKGDRERAIEDYKQALSLNPSEQTKKAVEAALAALTSTGGAPNEAKPAAPSGQAPEAAPAAQSNPARQDESGQIDFGDQ